MDNDCLLLTVNEIISNRLLQNNNAHTHTHTHTHIHTHIIIIIFHNYYNYVMSCHA